jgi:DNA-binding beta-propeller fold protein YncE
MYTFILNELFLFSKFLEFHYVKVNSYDHTNHTTNTISCHKINGDKLWEFQDAAIIRKPFDVAVDKDLNVYVASLDNNSVVVRLYNLIKKSCSIIITNN